MDIRPFNLNALPMLPYFSTRSYILNASTYGKYKVSRKRPRGKEKKEIRVQDKVEMKHFVDSTLSKAMLNELFLQISTFVYHLASL